MIDKDTGNGTRAMYEAAKRDRQRDTERIRECKKQLDKAFDAHGMTYDMQAVNWVHRKLAEFVTGR